MRRISSSIFPRPSSGSFSFASKGLGRNALRPFSTASEVQVAGDIDMRNKIPDGIIGDYQELTVQVLHMS